MIKCDHRMGGRDMGKWMARGREAPKGGRRDPQVNDQVGFASTFDDRIVFFLSLSLSLTCSFFYSFFPSFTHSFSLALL